MAGAVPELIDLTAEDSTDGEEEFVPPTPASTTGNDEEGLEEFVPPTPESSLGAGTSFLCGMCGDDMQGKRMAAGLCGHVFCAGCLQLRAECPTCCARLTCRIELVFG